jgi:four helix bundle protein
MTQAVLEPMVAYLPITATHRETDIIECEKVFVYQQSLALADMVFDLSPKMSMSLQSSIGNMLCQTVLDVPNSIAKGNATWSKSLQRRCYQLANKSVRECVSVAIMLHRREGISLDEYVALCVAARDIEKMLTKFIETLA